MKPIRISDNECNYLKDDGTYLLEEHVYWCNDFNEGFGLIQYFYESWNLVNSEGKLLLKHNADDCCSFYKGFAQVKINNVWYKIDKEYNFFNVNIVPFKVLYNKYPNIRSELIEIIKKYTYFDVNDYFNI